MLVNDSILGANNLKVFSGLPEESPPRSKIAIMAANFAIIAKAFNMDLRSQQQSFRNAEAAISALDDSEPFYCFYMFFLAALSHYNKTYFEQVVKSPSIALNLEQEQCHFIDANIAYSCIVQDRNNIGFGRRKEERSIKVSDVFKKYRDMANRNIQQISRMEIDNEYPHSVKRSIQLSLPSYIYREDENNFLSLSRYPQLLRMAGQIK